MAAMPPPGSRTELARWPVRAASGHAVFLPGDRSARGRRARYRRDRKPRPCRAPFGKVAACGSLAP